MFEDDSSDGIYDTRKRICCSVATFKVTNCCWGLFSLAMFVAGIVGLVLEGGYLILFPSEFYIAALALGGYSFFFVIIGYIGICARVEVFFIFYLFFIGLGLLGQTLAFTFLLLYANDVATVNSIDNVAQGAQEEFENNLADFAEREPEKWRDTQNSFDCCGIDFEFLIDEEDQAGVDLIESGDRCAEGEQQISDFRVDAAVDGAEFNENGDFVPALNDEVIGVEQEFFCKHKISAIVQENTPFIAAGLGVLLLLQLSAIVSGTRMYWVPYFRGGWLFTEEELEEMAHEKGLKLPQKREESGIMAPLRNGANRLSFRIRNAMTADPAAPQGAGFLKRLSYKGGGAPAFGQPGPPPKRSFTPGSGNDAGPEFPPREPPSPPRGFKRISQNLTMGFSAMGSAFRHPFGRGPSPPGLGPKSAPAGPPPVAPRGMLQSNSDRNVRQFQSQGAGYPHGMMSKQTSAGTLNSYESERNDNSARSTPRFPGMAPMQPQQPPAPPGNLNQSSYRSATNINSNGMRTTDISMPPPPPPDKVSHSQASRSAPSFNQPPSFRENNDSSRSRGGPSLDMFYGNSNRSNGAPPAPPPSLRYQRQPSAPINPPNVSSGGRSKGSKVKKKVKGGKKKGKKSSFISPVEANGGGGMLSQIRQGTQLSKTVTNDRSGPNLM